MSEIKIGDRVLCVNSKNHIDSNGKYSGLKEQREYIIYGMKKCSCGDVSYDVGFVDSPFWNSRCSKCTTLSPHGGIWWASSTRFVKVKEEVRVVYYKSNVKIEEPILN